MAILNRVYATALRSTDATRLPLSNIEKRREIVQTV